MCLDKNYSITRLVNKSILTNEVWVTNLAKFTRKMNDENR